MQASVEAVTHEAVNQTVGEEVELGTVKWFDCAKGYGFISGSQPGDIMIHFKQIDMEGYRALKAGDNVQYKATFDESRGSWKAEYAKVCSSE